MVVLWPDVLGLIPFGITSTISSGTPKTSTICSRMKVEQAITRSERFVIQRSTPSM